jgi:hypothetical protein
MNTVCTGEYAIIYFLPNSFLTASLQFLDDIWFFHIGACTEGLGGFHPIGDEKNNMVSLPDFIIIPESAHPE